jgi:hypothetical protein
LKTLDNEEIKLRIENLSFTRGEDKAELNFVEYLLWAVKCHFSLTACSGRRISKISGMTVGEITALRDG